MEMEMGGTRRRDDRGEGVISTAIAVPSYTLL
jgi:hypothetical protein